MNKYDYKVNFENIEYFYEIHEVLKRDLDFPDYYGGSLDALWDCLTDQLLSGLTYIEIYNTEKIPKKYHEKWLKVLEIFRETKHAYDDRFSDNFFVTVVHADGSREVIE